MIDWVDSEDLLEIREKLEEINSLLGSHKKWAFPDGAAPSSLGGAKQFTLELLWQLEFRREDDPVEIANAMRVISKRIREYESQRENSFTDINWALSLIEQARDTIPRIHSQKEYFQKMGRA